MGQDTVGLVGAGSLEAPVGSHVTRLSRLYPGIRLKVTSQGASLMGLVMRGELGGAEESRNGGMAQGNGLACDQAAAGVVICFTGAGQGGGDAATRQGDGRKGEELSAGIKFVHDGCGFVGGC